jgi:transcriptional regulator with XRE-family HTH domain
MIGDRLKKLRADHNLLQKDIYDVLHIDKSTYSKYEKGILKPSIDILEKLSKFFNVSSDYILGSIDEPVTLSELKFLKELKVKTDDELIKEHEFVNDSGKVVSKKDIKKMLAILRAYED